MSFAVKGLEEKAFMEEKGARLGFTQQEEFQEEEKGEGHWRQRVWPEPRPGGIGVCGVFGERVCGLVWLGHGTWKPQTDVRGSLLLASCSGFFSLGLMPREAEGETSHSSFHWGARMGDEPATKRSQGPLF